ncbi:MAG: oligosaccharide flippase family protein [Aphanocapsa sp. GSE-SYN-MK-11-07L]|jgi:O-antigen/teichoic acid export membrane protein|nr:oligosaccharide flippase family protein [Aphanocapsa sp. GSE-SYN-MK-11-07L]
MAEVGKIARSSLWISASFAIARAAYMISQIVLARKLTEADLGIWSLVYLVVVLANLFRESAIAQVLIQRGIEDKKLVNAVYSLGINVSICVFALQVGVGWLLSLFITDQIPLLSAQILGFPVQISILIPLTAVTALVFLIGAGAGTHGAVMSRQMKFRELAICELSAGLARLGGALVAVHLGAGIWSFAIGELSNAFVESSLKRSLSGAHFRYQLRPDPAVLSEVIGYIRGMIGVSLAVYTNTSSDNLIIGRLLGVKALGNYNLAYQLAMFPVFIVSTINRVNLAVISQQTGDRQRNYVCRCLELYALVAALLFGLAFVAAPWLIPLLYGQKWLAAVPIFQIVLVFAYARGFMHILGTSLNALGYPGKNAFINWMLVPLSVPAYFVGAKLGGAIGVAIAVALVMGVVATAWFWLSVCRVAGWQLSTLIQPILLPTSIAVGSLLLLQVIPLPLPILLQPLLLISLYGISLSVLSKGEIPRSLLKLIKRTLEREKAPLDLPKSEGHTDV